MTNNSIKYLQRNGIGNIVRDKKWRRKEIKWNEMKRNVAINIVCILHSSICTVKIHNDSINEFHRLDKMEFMSIEWEIVTDVLVLFCALLSVSQSVIEPVSAVSRSILSFATRNCDVRSVYTVQSISSELFSSFNL